MAARSLAWEARAMARLRSSSGQTSAEYLGVVLVVAALIAGIVGAGVGATLTSAIEHAVCEVAGTACGEEPGPGQSEAGRPDADGDGLTDAEERERETSPHSSDSDGDGVPDPDEVEQGSDPKVADSDGDGIADADDPVPAELDADGDGLSDGEEVALGTDAESADSDGDGTADREEYEQGTDPAQAIAPLTDENYFKPWERVGMSEDEWRDFEQAMLDEVNPDGIEGFLLGSPYIGVTLDEDGELAFIEVQENGLGSGLVRGLVGAGRGLSVAQAGARAAARLPAAVRAPLSRLGLVPGATRLPRAPAPPTRPGTALGSLDDLGRPTGAAATVTRETLGSGTRAARGIRPPGYDATAGHARGHLIGRQLGGSGTDSRNLVTLFQRPANSPVMRGFENQVRAAAEAGEAVRYTAVPVYRGTEAIPRAVTLSARGSRGFRLDVTVLNKGG